jgi:hypothetical protein
LVVNLESAKEQRGVANWVPDLVVQMVVSMDMMLAAWLAFLMVYKKVAT